MKNRTTPVSGVRCGIFCGGRLFADGLTKLVPVIVGVTLLVASSTVRAQEVQSLEHDTTRGRYNSLVQVDADTYALAYEGDGNDVFIKTFTISAAGFVPVTLMTFEVN